MTKRPGLYLSRHSLWDREETIGDTTHRKKTLALIKSLVELQDCSSYIKKENQVIDWDVNRWTSECTISSFLLLSLNVLDDIVVYDYYKVKILKKGAIQTRSVHVTCFTWHVNLLLNCVCVNQTCSSEIVWIFQTCFGACFNNGE